MATSQGVQSKLGAGSAGVNRRQRFFSRCCLAHAGGLSHVQQTVVPSHPFGGSIAAGEPHAALAARDSLKAGGSAVDSAASLALALSVTMPSRASLWAGGVCPVHDTKKGERQAYSFIHPTSEEGEAPPPMLVRSLALMHAARGRLRWSAIPAAAERPAFLGHPVSRALAQDIRPAPVPAAAVFGGRPVGEGDLLVQPELAGIPGRMSVDGPGVLYSGPVAESLGQGTTAAVVRLEEAALGHTPSAQEPLFAEGDDWDAYFAAADASAGLAQAAMRPRLVEDDRIADGDRLSLPAAGGGTGFAVVDAYGLAIACGPTMNAPFGAARTAAGTGIAIAATRPESTVDPALSPFLVAHESGDDLRFVGAASGMGAEANGPVVALWAILEADTLESAVALPRAARGSVVVEASGPEVERARLGDAGFALTEVGKIGFVAAVRCRERAPGDKGGVCRAHADPRSAALAVQAFDE